MEKKISICSFYQRHAKEGSPGHTHAIKSNHGNKNVRTHFERAGMDKKSNHNRGYEIVVTYDPRRSTIQSPMEQESGLGPLIGHWVGTLNCVIS